MIKTVAYFPLQCALNSGPVMSAVLDSLQGSGIQTRENSWDCDAVVIWSVLWHGRMQANKQVYQHYRNQNKPVIIVEIGSLYRGHTWKISVNNTTALGFYGHHNNLDWDRPHKLGISLAVQSITKPNIVVALQHTRSLQVDSLNGDLNGWIQQTVAEIAMYTDRPITLRPHPRNRVSLPTLPNKVTIEHPQKLTNTYDSFDMHYDCHAVVNYNSGPGIQAAIAGVRPIVDASSLAAPVGIKITNIEQPYEIDRDLWLVELCHTEYTLAEIKQGSWIKRLAQVL